MFNKYAFNFNNNVSRGTLSYKFTKILIINISKLLISPYLELLNYFPGNKLDNFLEIYKH